jgi:hypothetical protein
MLQQPEATRKWIRRLSDLIPLLLKHLLHLVQLDRSLALSLILAKDMDLAARDLVTLDRTFLCMEGAHVAQPRAAVQWVCWA